MDLVYRNGTIDFGEWEWPEDFLEEMPRRQFRELFETITETLHGEFLNTNRGNGGIGCYLTIAYEDTRSKDDPLTFLVTIFEDGVSFTGSFASLVDEMIDDGIDGTDDQIKELQRFRSSLMEQIAKVDSEITRLKVEEAEIETAPDGGTEAAQTRIKDLHEHM